MALLDYYTRESEAGIFRGRTVARVTSGLTVACTHGLRVTFCTCSSSYPEHAPLARVVEGNDARGAGDTKPAANDSISARQAAKSLGTMVRACHVQQRRVLSPLASFPAGTPMKKVREALLWRTEPAPPPKNQHCNAPTCRKQQVAPGATDIDTLPVCACSGERALKRFRRVTACLFGWLQHVLHLA